MMCVFLSLFAPTVARCFSVSKKHAASIFRVTELVQVVLILEDGLRLITAVEGG